MENRHVDRRVAQMDAEGTQFRVNANVGGEGSDAVSIDEILGYDAVVLAGGATAWRDLPIPGREFTGVYQAMEFLPGANRVQLGDYDTAPVDVKGRRRHRC
jgi:glutamate synthase (NADPH/NADH) small chain